MPTVHKEAGCTFMIYLKEHSPAHVHVYVGDGMAKLRLSDGLILEAVNVKQSDLKKALRIMMANRDKLYTAWVKLHGEDEGWA